MKNIFFLFFILFTGSLFAQRKSDKTTDEAGVKDIDVVFCLDLSASTNGLLSDLKENYWSLISHSFNLKPTPRLRIGIVGFGRPSFMSKTYYVKVLSGLTQNYDSLYEVIDKLNVNVEKGDQFVGPAMMVALREIEWSKKKGAAKMIMLMDNGTVNLGPSNLDDACDLAKSKGIVVHTAYCTNAMMEKEIKGWEKIAYTTNGTTTQIVINKKLAGSVTMSAKELWQLNKSFNNTFIAYGDSGTVRYRAMTKVDSLAVYSTADALQSRMLYKAIRPEEQFKDWDLITYSRTDGFNLYNLDRATMPDEFTNTVGPDMLNIIKQKQADRQRIAEEIKTTMAAELEEIRTNRLMKEDLGDEGYFNRIVIKAFMKTALGSGFWL